MSINGSCLPLYKQYFSKETQSVNDWEKFKSTKEELNASLSSRQVDFSIDHRTWIDSMKSIAILAVKLFLIFDMPYLALALLVRHIAQRMIMIPLYPAQSFFVKKFFTDNCWNLNILNAERKKLTESKNCICRDVVIEKNGVRYSGMLMGNEGTINNGKWVLQATGNAELIEYTIEEAAHMYQQNGYNILMINGPSVGKSQGKATPNSMGDAQDAGICFLETAIKAKKIVLAGRSLGGAAIGLAILKHKFKKDINYLVIQQMTFDRASNISGKIMGLGSPCLEWLVAKIIQICGCEMDSVAASKKLSKLGIQEVIVQATTKDISKHQPDLADFTTDQVIMADASLAYRLIKENVMEKKCFYGINTSNDKSPHLHMTNRAFSIPRPEIEQL